MRLALAAELPGDWAEISFDIRSKPGMALLHTPAASQGIARRLTGQVKVIRQKRLPLSPPIFPVVRAVVHDRTQTTRKDQPLATRF